MNIFKYNLAFDEQATKSIVEQINSKLPELAAEYEQLALQCHDLKKKVNQLSDGFAWLKPNYDRETFREIQSLLTAIVGIETRLTFIYRKYWESDRKSGS